VAVIDCHPGQALISGLPEISIYKSKSATADLDASVSKDERRAPQDEVRATPLFENRIRKKLRRPYASSMSLVTS